MTRILIAAALIALPLTANAQAVVSNDCQLSRFIEAYAWQAVDDAERNNVSAPLKNGLRVYLRTVQQQTKKVCRSAA
ncbi:hypothetical protein A4U53_030910 [Rhizobium ruizarguesonis]|uniref:Uncharacterized protein n=2 Tax=Rhizobium TaxID=379 RepID=A0A179BTZ1_RHILE|nr:hypothetical protein [Rhizobium leguminosarum]OAP95117.1 hypothetical protein A4U53_18010 [Rhizobium leguminosarum]